VKVQCTNFLAYALDALLKLMNYWLRPGPIELPQPPQLELQGDQNLGRGVVQITGELPSFI
jgi:hypothetical protein